MVLPQPRRKDDVRSALDSLRHIVRALRLSATDSERALGISMAQLFVLQQLADGRPRSIVELAAETLTDPSSVSVVVQRLVARKLVSRRADRADARRAQLTLTSAGRALLARAPEPVQEKLLASLEDLSDRRLAELARSLGRLAHAIGVPAGEPTLFFEDAPKSRRSRRG
jgi:DNA-binding MarR family transcriptional regulator